MNTERKIQPSPDVLARELGDDTVLLDLKSGTYFGLDKVGARIWELVMGGQSEESILDALTEEFDGERSAMRADLHRLLDEMAEQGLITRQP